MKILSPEDALVQFQVGIVWFKSLYCEPRRGWFRESITQDVPGLYIGLAQFGFAHGTSPGLEDHIAWRDKKLLPGSEFAGKRIVVQIDGGRLKTRGAMTLKSNAAPPEETQVRMAPTKNAIEHNAKLIEDGGRSKANKGKKTYRSDWREPKFGGDTCVSTRP